MSNLVTRGPGQVTELVVRTLRQNQVHFAQRVEHGESICDHRRVVVLLGRNRGQDVQELMVCLQELGRGYRPRDLRNSLAERPQAVVVVVLVQAPGDGQACCSSWI